MAKFARGTTATFEVVFKDDGGDPVVPFDSTYPQVAIKDPTGILVASGVGNQTTTPGKWDFDWTVPPGASIDPGWSVEWNILSLNRESLKQTQCFEVYDQIEVEDSLDREAAYLALCGQSERLIYRSETKFVEVSLSLVYGDMVVWTAHLGDDTVDIKELFADGLYNYWVDSPELTSPGTIVVFWTLRETSMSKSETVLQYLRVADNRALVALPYLRGLLDKLNKVQDTALSYTDSELYQYLERGADLLNGVHPFTTWPMGGIPGPLMSWWILLAGWWGLNARQILEIEVSHDFQGQTVNLNYDHASPLGEIIARWESMVWERLPAAKTAIYRRSAGPGMVAVRPYRLSVENRVFRASAAQNALADFPGLVGRLGLLW